MILISISVVICVGIKLSLLLPGIYFDTTCTLSIYPICIIILVYVGIKLSSLLPSIYLDATCTFPISPTCIITLDMHILHLVTILLCTSYYSIRINIPEVHILKLAIEFYLALIILSNIVALHACMPDLATYFFALFLLLDSYLLTS